MITFEREGQRPLDILQRLVQIDPEFVRQAQERGTLDTSPEVKSLGSLHRHPEGADDPNELLKHRFLCRGGAALLVGPTGVGKSSFSMQAAICWAVGRPGFGLTPARPLRILIVQAENDEGDMAEMRDGVLAGMNLTPEEQRLAFENIRVVTEDTKTREGFIARMDQILSQHPTDIAFADPALAYLGGDASSQRDVSPFLRNMINPLIHRHNIGFVLVHHVNKPPSGEQKAQWQAGDFAYLGAGSAEFPNWARAVIAIRSIGSDSVFELLLAKRGRRARWVDDMGRPTNARYIAYHRQPGVICWRDAEQDEVAPFLPPEKAVTVQTMVDMIAAGQNTKAGLVGALADRFEMKKSKAYELVALAIASGAVRVAGLKNKQTLVLTGKLAPRQPVEDADEG